MKNFIHSIAFIICFTFLFHTASAQRLSGTYTIGPSGNYTSIAAAMSAMQTYGISGNVTFNISNGTYGASFIDFASGIPNQGTYDTITFTSSTNNSNNVTIASSGTALTINNAKNLVIKHLTIGSSSTSKGVQLNGSCNNVEISNCNIRSNPTGNNSSNAGIYYNNTTASLTNNIRILNNKIDGGYYGIYFHGYAATNFASTNFIVNNNVLSNAYLYGIYCYFVSLNSFSNNSITSRTSNHSNSFYGVYMYYSNSALINSNRVQVLTTAINNPYGMRFYYLNYRGTTNSSLISNNEILVFTNSSYYGMFVQYSRADIYNNSILVGGNGAARALYVYLLAGLPVNIRNNNLHTMAATAYPIYINSASVNYLGSTLKMDYNNYYNQTNIGYAGVDVKNMADWQELTGQDAHSVSVYPNYSDLFSYRLKTDGEGLICPRITSVPKDIYDTTRQAVTSMGAYHDYVPKSYDTKILNLLSPQANVSVGVNTPVRVTIMNMGANTVDSINIHWEVNGIKQTYLWIGGPLSLGDSTSAITIGYFMPLVGENQIKVYTNPTGGKIDNNPLNDTVAITVFGCKNTISSVYTVGGSSADFTTIGEAIEIISYCGISTPTTIAINPGTYYENIVVPTIKGTSEVNTLTITAANGDSSSVIIQSLSSSPCFLLYNTNNLIIKNLTIKGVNTGVVSTAIKFQNNNRNILITNNHITVSMNNPSSTTSTDIMALHSYTSLDTNITISNNFINGSGGIYFYSQTSAMTSNINILNNRLENIYYYGIYTYYTRVGLIKNNKIYQNPMAAIWGGGSGYGLYVYYSLGVTNTITDISNNLIRGAFGYFTYLYYCWSNSRTTTYVLFTNNSLIKTGAGNVNYLLYAFSGRLQCVNNTFVNIGSGTITNMAYFYGYSGDNMNVSNNIFTSLTGTTNYLIYWSSSGNSTLDYNNYYTVNGNIAYHYNVGTYASLSSWQVASPTYNVHSKNVHPHYIDSLNYTKPTNWYPLMCPRNEFVLADIDGNPRTATTYMGCYETLFANDAGLLNFISPTATSTGGDTTKIIVKLFNYGTSTLNSITCKYKVNGVLYPQVIFNNLNLAKHKDTNLTIGVFVPIVNNSDTIEAWCESPNGNVDQNVYNDSIIIITKGCSMVLNGEYTVGNSTADFTTIADALNALKACGISGPVVFKLYNGTYFGFSIDTSYIGSSTTNTITFTSFTNNADNVIISSNTTALTLSKTHNIKFTHLTFDAQMGSKGINFIDTCSNIEIRTCKIKTNLTSNAAVNVGINKETTSFSINNISIIDNTITGGYTGIQLYGASALAAIGKNIRIDSNTITDAYRNGVYARDYIRFESISNNTITSRSNNAGTNFDGLYFHLYSEVDTIKNNKINTTKSTTTIYANGIYCYLVNYYSSTSANLHLINNEIKVRGNNNGIYLYYARSQVIHNSVYITGTGNSNGIYIYNTTSTPVNVMNNNIVNMSTGTSATAIYVSNANTPISADYNNYYSSQGTPCRVSTPLYNLTSWQNATGLDYNSSSILPTYTNLAVDLRVKGDELLCRKLPGINYDLYGTTRRQLTNMGAYHTYVPLAYDIMPLSIISPIEDVSNYSSIPVRISVLNRGDSIITDFDIHWSVNGVAQPVFHWTGTPLAIGDSTLPILIDYYSPSMGFNVFQFYTSLPNGKQDANPANDTIEITSFACGAELSGIYTIGGSSSDFEDIATAIRVLKSCGINENVVFQIKSGVYNENISLLESFMDASSPYTVTFTSAANHADSVVIKSNATAIELGDVKNLIFEYLTIDVTNGQNGIHFSDGSENIKIEHCKIKLNPTSTNNTHIGIYKPNNTGMLDNVIIKNNWIDGGYYGIQMYGGYVSGTYYLGTNIVVDSNIVSNSYYCGMYFNYSDIESISYNQISSRASNPYTYYYGIYVTYSVANIIGNKISNPTIINSYSYGIYLYYYFNYYFSTVPGLIANNEIITNTGNRSYGIYTNYYIRANIINNSIYSKGGANCNGIYVANLTSGITINIKNNNLVNQAGYPIYLNSGSLSDLTMDYNNYYAPTYIGYYSGGITSLSTWKSTTGKDQHSVNVLPNFIDTNVNLELQHGIGLNCPRDIDVLTDIKGLSRKTITTMGAYEPKYDLELTSIAQPINNSNLCLLEPTDIKLVISNLDPVPVDFTNDSMRVHIRITGTMAYQKDTTIKIGNIIGYGRDTFTVVPNYTSLDTGRYYILAYIDNMDINPINDTVRSNFYVEISYQHKDTITLCDDEFPFKYGDSTFKVGTVSGNYPVHFTLPTGCDSLITLTLKVNPTYHHNRSLTICDNQLPLSYGDSIFPIGTTTGTYFIHFTLPTGCDSLIQLALTVHPTYKHFDTLTLCDSDFPFKYGDSTFKVGTVSGTYPVHFTLPTGCDSLIQLALTVHPTYKHFDTLMVCDSDFPFNYGDSTFKVGTVSGNYPVHFTLPTGCDSLITLTLKVNPTYHFYRSLTICDDQLPLSYGDSIFPIGTVTGNYPIHFTLPTGCDSLIQLALTVHPTYKHFDTLTLCDSDFPFNYGDSTFKVGTVSGTYPIHFTLPTGCDSLVTLTLKVHPTYKHYDTLTICDSDLPFNYGDSTFKVGTVSGNYPVHFTLPTGCDSLINLTLNVNPTYSLYDTLVVCNGDVPYTYGDSILNVSGNYRVVFSSSKGCDSIVFLNFNVFNCESVDVVGICDSELPYAYGDSIFNASGIYLVNFKTYLGLDSVVALTLHVYSTYNHFDTLNVCNSEFPIMYGDSTISIGGNYTIEFASIYGCDSTIDLAVYTLPSYNLFDTVSICDGELPYTYSDSLLVSAGSYTFTLTTIEGCDSIIHLTLLVYPTYNNWDTLTICSGELPYQYGDSIFAVGSVSGTYPVHFTLPTGCDSLINLTLIINNSYLHTDTVAICYGDLPFTYGDSVFAVGSTSGDYSIIFTLPTGCDSIILLTLNIFNCQSTNIVDICSNELPFNYGDSTFYAAGIYQVVFQSHSGLDSVVTLTLRVHNNYNYYDTVSICNSEFPYTYGDTVITTSGDYIISLLSSYGCDSIINLTLLTLPSYAIYDTIIICDNQFPYTYGDTIITTSGDYIISLLSSYGCDSIINLTLLTLPSYAIYDTIDICDNQLPYTYGDSIYNDFGDYDIFLKTEYGCDSITHLHLLSLSSYVYSDTLSICSNELPYTYGDTIFDIGTMNGDYIIYLTSINGCDSVVNLNLSIYPISEESIYAKICESELPYYFAGKEFDSGGTYEIVLVSIDGCDSIINLYLTVKNAPIAPDTIMGKIDIREKGNYTYSVEAVDSASAYIWTISNEEWLGSSTTNTIVVFISTSGSAYISVQAANECGSSEATEIYVQSSVGIKELNNTAEVNLYPNPANNYFYLKMNDIQGKTLISISDITGKVLRREEVDINSANQLLIFSTLHLSKGLYYVSIVNNNHTIVKKLIIE